MKDKPRWPYPNIGPLRAHVGSGQWYKTIQGKSIYFGVLSDPVSALKKYLAWAKLATDADVPVDHSAVTLGDGLNRFLDARHAHVDNGALSPSQYMRYKRACKMILTVIDRKRAVVVLRPADFDRIVKSITGSPRTVGNAIRDMRVAMKWIADTYNARPIYGQSFKRPPARAIRRTAKRRELWPAADILAVLAESDEMLRACIMLAINCGFGQTDCGTFRRDNFSLEGHWFSRQKTGIERRCPFWPETIAAIHNADRWRPDVMPELLFVTKYGKPLVREEVFRDAEGDVKNARRQDAIQWELRKACKRARVKYRPFYSLRHTFRSVADRVPDATAIKVIMGHALPGMDGVYVQLLADDWKRLKVVTSVVHEWLYGFPLRPLELSGRQFRPAASPEAAT